MLPEREMRCPHYRVFRLIERVHWACLLHTLHGRPCFYLNASITSPHRPAFLYTSGRARSQNVPGPTLFPILTPLEAGPHAEGQSSVQVSWSTGRAGPVLRPLWAWTPSGSPMDGLPTRAALGTERRATQCPRAPKPALGFRVAGRVPGACRANE